MSRGRYAGWLFPQRHCWMFIASGMMHLLAPGPGELSAAPFSTSALRFTTAFAWSGKGGSIGCWQQEKDAVHSTQDLSAKSPSSVSSGSATTQFFPPAIEIGQPFRWELEVIVPAGTLVMFPDLNFAGTGLESWGHVDRWDEPLPGDASRRRWRRTWELVFWDLKEIWTPELAIETRTGETTAVLRVPSKLIPRQAPRLDDWESRVPLPAAAVWDEDASATLPQWQMPWWQVVAALVGAILVAASCIWFWRQRRGGRPSRSAFEQVDRQLRLWEQAYRTNSESSPAAIAALSELIREYLATRTALADTAPSPVDGSAIPIARTWEEWERYGLGDEDLIRDTAATWGPLTALLEELRYSGEVVTPQQWSQALAQARRWLIQYEQELQARERAVPRSLSRFYWKGGSNSPGVKNSLTRLAATPGKSPHDAEGEHV